MYRHLIRPGGLRVISRCLSTKNSKTLKDVGLQDTFGTLSQSGKNSLAVNYVEQLEPDDYSAHNKKEYDLAARKNSYYYNREISFHARQGGPGLRKALQLFHDMKTTAQLKPEIGVYSVLILGSAKAGHTKEAFKLYEEALSEHGKVTNSTVTALIMACYRTPFPEQGLNRLNWFLDDIRCHSRRLNDIHYSCAVAAYCEFGKLDLAVKMFKECIEQGGKPTDRTFMHFLRGFNNNKKYGALLAFRLLKVMKMYGIKLDIKLYGKFLDCLKNCGFGSQKLLEETLENLPATTNFHQRLIYKQARRKKENESFRDKLHTEFEEVPWLGNIGKTVESIIMDVLSEERSQVLQETTSCDNSIQPDSIEYSSDQGKEQHSAATRDISSVLQSGTTDARANYDLLEIPNLLSGDNLKLVDHIKKIRFDRLDTPMNRLKLFGGIKGFLEELRRNHCRPNVLIFTQLMHLVCRDLDDLVLCYKLLKEYRVEPDIVFFDNFITLLFIHHSRVRNIALDCLEQMQLHNLKPQLSTCEALAYGCYTWALATRLLQDIERCGFVVSDRIIHVFFRRAMKSNNIFYLYQIIQLILSIKSNFKPDKILIDKLEHFRLVGRNAVLNQEKNNPADGDHNSDPYFDKFSEVYSRWMKTVEVVEEAHPWEQFMIHDEDSERIEGERDFINHIKAMQKIKNQTLEQGGQLGNVSFKAHQVSRYTQAQD